MSNKPCDFSPDMAYRYTLWREWGTSLDPYAMFIGLNPSTADDTKDDPTVRRCINFAKDWGYGGMVMTNLFGFRATDPRDMKAVEDPVGPLNDAFLKKTAAGAGIVVACWGTHGAYRGRGDQVKEMLKKYSLSYLAISKDGHPKHPLYLRKDLVVKRWIG